MQSPVEGMWDVTDEFLQARLPDKRLVGRTVKVMKCLARSPGDSFPDAMGSEKELEGLYRLLNNPRVNHPQLLESHVLAAVERAKAAGDVLAIHDTTSTKFPGLSLEEIGELNTGTAGFLAHTTLLLDATVERCPLGVIALRTIHRKPGRPRRDLGGSECAKLENKESARWFDAVRETEERLFGKARVLHVMDREGDSYELYARLLARGSRFVIRGDDRTCLFDGERGRIKEVLSKQRVIAERDVPLAKRTTRIKAPNSARPVREARMARLSVAGCRITLNAPKYIGSGSDLPQQIMLNVVHVFEAAPPADQPPVEWFLLTSEPIETDEQLLRVIDIYRHRWVIEEFFKALKSGCLYQERQLESREALLNALVLFLPIACQLLWMRSQSRTHPDAPAEGLVTKTQEQVIRHFSSRKLSASPTVRELIWAIAAIGGHLKSNGEPGWQVLGRAWTRVLEYEAVWLAAAATFQKTAIS